MPVALRRSASTFTLERSMLCSLVLALSLTACQEPDQATGPSMSQVVLHTDTTLTASRDGYVTSEHPNRNGGAKDSMDVARPLRSLVAFDQAAIANAVGAGTLTRATLRLTIGRTAENWGPNGRTIDVHRVTVPWTEAGETYNCAIDASPGNSSKECSGATEWAMASTTAPPWASPSTAQASVVNNQSGVVEFNVTADVLAFLAGTPNEGWIVKKSDETKQGRVVFLTKEGGAAPELVLTVAAPITTRPPIPDNVYPPDDSLYVLLNPSNPENQIYRRLAEVSFLPSATDSMVAAFFREFEATVVGGVPGLRAYFIRFPDPGATLQALDSALTRMRAFPGVEDLAGVSRTLPPGRVEGRTPNDGVGFSRADWVQGNPGTHTWALRAIRAPLAWGCETGTYSAGRVKVAILEQAFYPNPDVAISARIASDTQRTQDRLADSLVDKWEWHGAAVAGALSASGDNGLGAVGAIWSSDLIVYEMTPSNRQKSNTVLAIQLKFRSDVIARQPRILSISSEIGIGASTLAERRFLLTTFRQVMDSVPGMFLVVATGDGDGKYTPTAVQNDTTSAIRSVLVELALSASNYRDRILFVGATAPGHTLYDDSNWIMGMTELAAPGENVGVVSLARGGSVYSNATLGNGTSFSAPLVAGVAAQLLSMNPFLLPSQVKRLLIDGAKLPRLDPMTGQLAPDSNRALQIPGTADQVYELDAYGSLSLLSASDDATPICGFPVITSFVNNPETGEVETSVRIARPGAALEVFRGEVGSVTVAQGGRRIGIDGYTTSRDVLLQNVSWSGTHNVAFRGYRQFLERDTAFIDYSTGPELLTIRGPGGPRGPFNVCEAFTGLFATACYSGPIASTGEWAQITVSRNNYDLTGCGPANGFYGSYLVPLGTGTRAPLRETSFEPCAPEAGAWNVPGASVLAWRSDGAVAWEGQSDVSYFVSEGYDDPLDPNPPGRVIATTSIETKFKQVSVVSGLTVLGERTVNNRLSYALGWHADGSTLISYEYAGLDWANCQRAVRAGLAPQIEITDSAGPVPWCGNAVMEPLPASRLGAPLASALRARGTVVAHPGRPLSPAERRVRALGQREVPRIVLVN